MWPVFAGISLFIVEYLLTALICLHKKWNLIHTTVAIWLGGCLGISIGFMIYL